MVVIITSVSLALTYGLVMPEPRSVDEWEHDFDTFCESLRGDEDFSHAVAEWIGQQVAQECAALQAALTEAQQKGEHLCSWIGYLLTTLDVSTPEDGVREVAKRLEERDALQRRVEALERTGAALVAKIAALRGGEAG